MILDFQSFPPPDQEVIEAMKPFLKETASLTSPHEGASSLRLAIKKAYEALSSLVGCDTDEQFVFTSSGAEAINQVIISTYLNLTRQTGKNHFVTSALAEAPPLLTMERLEHLGCKHSLIPAGPNGFVTLQSFIETISPRTALVSLACANGLTGVIQPMQEISELCKSRKILLHIDASHVVGRSEFYWTETHADFVTFSGESIGGPSGTGALFIKNAVELEPLILGGREQGGLRAGNFNAALLIGLGVAAQKTTHVNFSMHMEVARLKSFFEQLLLKEIPALSIVFGDQVRVPHVTSLIFPHVVNEALAFLLHKKGLYASFGGGSCQQLHPLLAACGIKTHSALSFTFPIRITEDQVREAVRRIIDAYRQLQKSFIGEECIR